MLAWFVLRRLVLTIAPNEFCATRDSGTAGACLGKERLVVGVGRVEGEAFPEGWACDGRGYW